MFLCHQLVTKLLDVHYNQCFEECAGHVLVFTWAYQSCLILVNKISFVETGKKCGKYIYIPYVVCVSATSFMPSAVLLAIAESPVTRKSK